MLRAALFVTASLPLALSAPAFAQENAGEAGSLRLYRLDCGSIVVNDLDSFSDTEAYGGSSKELTDSCYLVRHGPEWLLWDTGLPDALADNPQSGPAGSYSVETTLASQLEELDLTPAEIDFVGISHAHLDHVGNLPMFPESTLILQKAEFDAVANFQPQDPVQAKAKAFILDSKNVAQVEGDHDIFGDGSVVSLFTPGHTPGHQALLVRLNEAGPVILSGDAAHFTENWETNGVPDFNTNRADTLASLDRLKGLAENLDARIVIQHEPSDNETLPKFPHHLE